MLQIGDRWIDGYHGLRMPCPRCGDDVLFHVFGPPECAEMFPVLAEQPCQCRLTIKQRLELWDAAEKAVMRMETSREQR